ncbi:MAG: c-type cytochrome [Magnetococcales bacterium]|nr:c-type cytochrome [Magnetococcales bacterium]
MGKRVVAVFMTLMLIASTGFVVAAEWADEAAIVRGGRLYDKWYEELDIEAPTVANPAYPASATHANDPKANWRCKECHGWDYKGRDGRYGSGKRATGIKGIQGMAGASPDTIVTILKDNNHAYTDKLSAKDRQDLALFVSRGQFDMDAVIDSGSGKPKSGDPTRGAVYYHTVCAQCHGDQGTKIKKMPPMGKVASENPWETLHKILNGEPGEGMPPLRAFTQIGAHLDILSYIQTLPKEK